MNPATSGVKIDSTMNAATRERLGFGDTELVLKIEWASRRIGEIGSITGNEAIFLDVVSCTVRSE